MTRLRRVVGVIDDDPSVGKALQRLFRTAGFDVSLYASAEECLANPARGKVECLILDVRLPGMSGVELLEHLQGESSVPTVLITAHEDGQIRSRAMAGGAIAFFLKPFDNRELLEAVLEALGTRED